jgi:small-conductance mechanosensitive channel
MDEPFTQVLTITPARSRYLALFLVLVHLGAVVAVACSGLPTQYKVVAVVLIAGVFIRTIRAWWFDVDRIAKYEFMLTAADEWSRRESGGQTVAMVAMPPVFVHPMLIVVRLVSSAGPRIRHDLILLPDNLDPAVSRRLRVRLRLPP